MRSCTSADPRVTVAFTTPRCAVARLALSHWWFVHARPLHSHPRTPHHASQQHRSFIRTFLSPPSLHSLLSPPRGTETMIEPTRTGALLLAPCLLLLCVVVGAPNFASCMYGGAAGRCALCCGMPTYYCDFCERAFNDTPSSRTRHLQSAAHRRRVQEHYNTVKRTLFVACECGK